MIILLTIGYSVITYAANRKVERQKYRLEKSMYGIEIRFYPKAIMATVTSRGESYMGNSNNHFRTLAGYIFGSNKSSEKISMTAPVHMDKDSSGNKMSFVMPSNYSMDKLPQPSDSLVNLHYSQEGYYAVLKFGGFANEHKIQKKIDELKSTLDRLDFKTLSGYSYLGYNAPWDIIGRENEIIVQIAYFE
jgi:hypothetical protein